MEVIGLDYDLFFIGAEVFVTVDTPKESAEDNLVEDLIRDEDKDSTSKDNPAKGENNRGHKVEESVTVRVFLCINKLDIVNDILITQGGSEIVKFSFAKNGVEIIRSNPVPEDPPADRDQPHHHDHHHNYVIQEVTAKLTAESSIILAAVLHLL